MHVGHFDQVHRSVRKVNLAISEIDLLAFMSIQMSKLRFGGRAVVKIIEAAAATQTAGLRPGYSAATSADKFANILDFTEVVRRNVAILNEVVDVFNAIMLQSGNVTDHLTGAN